VVIDVVISMIGRGELTEYFGEGILIRIGTALKELDKIALVLMMTMAVVVVVVKSMRKRKQYHQTPAFRASLLLHLLYLPGQAWCY